MYSRMTLKLKVSSISFTRKFYALRSMQQGVSRINRLTHGKVSSTLKAKGRLMVLFPVQRIDPVIEVFIQPVVQTDVQEEKVYPFPQIRRIVAYGKSQGGS